MNIGVGLDAQDVTRSTCKHERVRISNEISIVCKVVADTEGIYFRTRPLSFQLNGEATTEDLLFEVSKDLKSIVLNRHDLKPYLRQMHFRIVLGSNYDALEVLSGQTRLKEFAQQGSPLHLLCGRVEVWLESKGSKYARLIDTVPDSGPIPSEQRSTFTLQTSTAMIRVQTAPPWSRPAQPSFGRCCSAQIQFTFEVDQALSLSDDHAAVVARVVEGSAPGIDTSADMLKNVRQRIETRIKRLRGTDTDDLRAGLMIKLWLKPQGSEALLHFDDPATMVHQFLDQNAEIGERRLAGKITLCKKSKICKCEQYADESVMKCCGQHCRIRCFHSRCVGLTEKPQSLVWYCPDCQAKL